jgi:hypothetical protein
MCVHNQLTTARHEEPLQAAARRRWAVRPRLAAAPHHARTGRAPGWYAGALRWLVRWPRPPGGVTRRTYG